MKKLVSILIILFLALNAFALVADLDTTAVTVYNSSAFVTKQASLSGSGAQEIKFYLPQETDTSTAVIVDDGATIKQIMFGSEDRDKLLSSVLLQVLQANIGQKVSLYKGNEFVAEGTLNSIVRDSYAVLKAENLSQVVSLAGITFVKAPKMPEILDREGLKDELSKKFAVVSENVFKDSRTLTAKYFVSGAKWNPVYQLFIESDELGKFNYLSNIVNGSSEKWENVSMKLIAGDPKMKQSYNYSRNYGLTKAASPMYEESAGSYADLDDSYSSSTLSEFYQYTLNRKFSIDKKSSVLIPLLSESIKLKPEYEWNAGSSQADYFVRLFNSTDEPWTAGWVSVYREGEYVGGNNIDWTQKDTNRRIYLSPVHDLKVKKESTSKSETHPNKTVTNYTGKLVIENHKAVAVDLKVKDRIRSDAKQFQSNQAYELKENKIEWDLEIQPGQIVSINYSYYTEYYKR